MVERKCEWCGNEFSVPPSTVKVGGGKFCSRSCQGKWRSKNMRGKNHPNWKGGKVKKTGEQCGKKFEVEPSRRVARFCSRKCLGLWNSENRCGENGANWQGGNVKKNCVWCGNEFEIKASHADLRFCCSRKCAVLRQSKNWRGENHPSREEKKRSGRKRGKVKKDCKWCGKRFEVVLSRADKAKFCSRECYSLWMPENCRGENGSNWQGGNVQKVCERCGKEFEVQACRVDRARFCSQRCYGLWFSENLSGENSHLWKGGISFEPYGLEWTEKLREEVRKRDNYTCAISGEIWQPGQEKFPVHHCDYDKMNNSLDNLITLSKSSHTCTNSNRRHWQTLLAPIAKGAEMRWNSFV